MSNIKDSILDMIGNTPMMKLHRFKEENQLGADIIVKLEYMNPAGSVKDRIAAAMIEEAESQGLLQKDSVIIEPTSGNTGIGLAAVAASKGYRLIIIMPDGMSEERKQLLRAYGAELVMTPDGDGMKGAIMKAVKLAEELPNSFVPSQFTNPSNPASHRMTTGPEIWKDTDGKIDYFVAGVGTGGTISGVGEYLKSKDSSIQVVAVEPASSPVLSRGIAGAHGIQGIGAGFIPNTLNTEIYDAIATVKEEQAFEIARQVAITEGLLIGISSGAALWEAKQLASKKENEGKQIVVLLPDGGERYLSTVLFS